MEKKMSYRAFMKQNVKQHENVKHIISDRFFDEETGEPIAFEFRTLKSKDVDAARDAAMTRAKKSREYDVNTTVLMHTLIAKAMVFPDLNDKELQDSYGVMGVSALISEMFDAKEYARLSEIVSDLAGFDKTDQDLIDDAKN
jgi:hypothetical protein